MRCVRHRRHGSGRRSSGSRLEKPDLLREIAPSPAERADAARTRRRFPRAIIGIEALAQAANEALGLPADEAEGRKSLGRLHALVTAAAETAEEALDEMNEIMAAVTAGSRSAGVP
jgi:hypothetical protein